MVGWRIYVAILFIIQFVVVFCVAAQEQPAEVEQNSLLCRSSLRRLTYRNP